MMDGGDWKCLLVSSCFAAMLMGCYALGHVIRPRLPDRHRSREMTEVLLAVTAMLVTFSAIVLGLTLNSSLEKLQHLNDLVGGLADQIVRLDDTLVQYGTEAQLAHVAVLNYTRGEALGEPEADASTMTRAALQQIEATVLRLNPPDDYHATIKHDALQRYNDVVDLRFRVLTEAEGSPNLPFNVTLGIWLALTYFVFGLNSEKNLYVLLALGLSTVAIAAAMFVILDMDTALGGLISISRHPLHQAVVQLNSG